jgi:hypothetical protein
VPDGPRVRLGRRVVDRPEAGQRAALAVEQHRPEGTFERVGATVEELGEGEQRLVVDQRNTGLDGCSSSHGIQHDQC